jgi:hypothetical protein
LCDICGSCTKEVLAGDDDELMIVGERQRDRGDQDRNRRSRSGGRQHRERGDRDTSRSRRSRSRSREDRGRRGEADRSKRSRRRSGNISPNGSAAPNFESYSGITMLEEMRDGGGSKNYFDRSPTSYDGFEVGTCLRL